ncbi:MAG: GNAT family N-acetyltransferase [Candidatus Bathyarchaeota archaeon]|nr:GNAT family N-acetyltransferase [Candidatus Bathyarchaeota archaeon]
MSDFLKNNSHNSVFSTWEWLSNWWKHFGEGKKLIILIIEDKNKILALAPFMYSKHSLYGLGNLKKISFVGTPETDYNDFIMKERKEKYFELFFDHLNEHYKWDYFQLKDIPETTTSIDLLRNSLKKRFPYYSERVTTLCPYLPLSDSMEDFMKRLGKNMRRNLRRNSRKLSENYRIKLKRYDEIGSVKETMEIFFNLVQKRWEAKAILGDFRELKTTYRDFYLDIARNFAKKGWLGLYFLTANDEPIAGILSFEYRQKIYTYLPGLDPEYSPYSIGNLMHMYLIERCIQKGLKEYDLMRGDVQHKNKFGTINRKNFDLCFTQKGLNLHFRIYDWLMREEFFVKLSTKAGLHLTLKN